MDTECKTSADNSIGHIGDRRQRTSNFTARELQYLCECVSNYREVIHNLKTDNHSSRLKWDAWKKIESEFQHHPECQNRTASQLKSCWKRLKQNAKKECGAFTAENEATNHQHTLAAPVKQPSGLSLAVDGIVSGELAPIDIHRCPDASAFALIDDFDAWSSSQASGVDGAAAVIASDDIQSVGSDDTNDTSYDSVVPISLPRDQLGAHTNLGAAVAVNVSNNGTATIDDCKPRLVPDPTSASMLTEPLMPPSPVRQFGSPPNFRALSPTSCGGDEEKTSLYQTERLSLLRRQREMADIEHSVRLETLAMQREAARAQRDYYAAMMANRCFNGTNNGASRDSASN